MKDVDYSLNKNLETLLDLCHGLDNIPHGSGIDDRWQIMAMPNMLVMQNAWHLLHDSGYYMDNLLFNVKIPLDRPHDFTVTFISQRLHRNSVRYACEHGVVDCIEQWMEEWLDSVL
jgi:hypothetical protein